MTSKMPAGLHPHAADDQPLAADPVRERAGAELGRPPDARVDRRQDRDLVKASPPAAKKSGKSPQAMPSLRLLTRPAWLAAKSRRSLQLVSTKISPNGRPGGCGSPRPSMQRRLVPGVAARVADEEDREQQPGQREDDAEVERLRAAGRRTRRCSRTPAPPRRPPGSRRPRSAPSPGRAAPDRRGRSS